MRGNAHLKFGGEDGIAMNVEARDVVVIPAGVRHCNLEASDDFLVAGAYPRCQAWNLRTGEPGERIEVLENIQKVPLPERSRVREGRTVDRILAEVVRRDIMLVPQPSNLRCCTVAAQAYRQDNQLLLFSHCLQGLHQWSRGDSNP